MINSPNIINKLNNFFNREYNNSLSEISLFKNADGTFELFNKYIISMNNGKYIVDKKHTYVNKEFSSLKNAVTWCIFDKRSKHHMSNRVELIDRTVESLNASIELHKLLIKKTKDDENKIIYYCKLTNEEVQKKSLINELNKLINDGKLYQNSQFIKKAKNIHF